GFESVPIPGGAARVIAGEFAKGERRRVVPLRRKRDEGRGRTERESEVHNAQAAGVESFDELEKDFRHSDSLNDERKDAGLLDPNRRDPHKPGESPALRQKERPADGIDFGELWRSFRFDGEG